MDNPLFKKYYYIFKELYYFMKPDLEKEIGVIFRKLSTQNRRQFHCVLQYVQFINYLKQEKSLRCGLELGAGYSTLLLSALSDKRSVEIFSVDADVEKLKKMFGSIIFLKIDNSLNIIPDYSISYEELKDFYNKKHNKIAGISTFDISNHVKSFINNNTSGLHRDDIKNQEEYLKFFFDDKGNLHFNKKFININNRFNNELKLLETKKTNKEGAIDKILNKVDSFDFIFFDCSEYSSLLEWNKLHNKIRKGGYAIFHDIYFPKSIKNFISCASVDASKNWKIMYKDNSTIQGLLIAKRIE